MENVRGEKHSSVSGLVGILEHREIELNEKFKKHRHTEISANIFVCISLIFALMSLLFAQIGVLTQREK